MSTTYSIFVHVVHVVIVSPSNFIYTAGNIPSYAELLRLMQNDVDDVIKDN